MHNEILVDVWREVCRHLEIAESTPTIARMLLRHLPIQQVIVRRIDRPRNCIETAAVGFESETGIGRSECTPDQMKQIAGWCLRGELSVCHEGQLLSAGLLPLVPVGVGGNCLIGPLRSSGTVVGALILVLRPGCLFEPWQLETAKALLDPFSSAMENDLRLREIAALREAAEADRQSLLTRLGRKDIAETIVGDDAGLRFVMERVELVARSDAPVLILGETGSGKEVVARAIHRRSPRASGPVIRVNCGAIPPELIDSQLFGHERGAFTGAVEMRKGWFERADGGTLFLDEIAELPLAAQVRLLRILQDGWFERIGGHHPINVDVRIIASTHRDLVSMVAQGRFREDLWYRIAVFPILLPPLRERTEDIPALAAHFAEKAAVRFGLPVLMPTDEDIRLLVSYAWPGNVRELGAVMDRAAILGNGVRLEVAKALGVLDAAPQLPKTAPSAAIPQPAGVSSVLPLDNAMRRHIESVLTLTHGRIEGPHGAAALLQINPHTLRARMRKLGIRWAKFRRA